MSQYSRKDGSATNSRTIPHTRIEDERQIEDIYEFGEVLGSGSFGVVNEATNKATGCSWAIKAVNKEKAGTSAVKLLEREVLIMKKIDHEHLIHLEEIYETSKRMYLVMELCDAGGIQKLLEKKTRFSEKETWTVINQLAHAVAYLHDCDIVHRDLKLENILLGQPVGNELLNIKLTDFGLSYVKGGVGSDSMMQSVCGTPMYMAPEVIDDLGYSQQCDIWSIGVIMYTLLTGRPPFRAETEEKLYELIKKGEVDFSDPCWETCHESAKNLLLGMLKVNPAYRRTAQEILNHPWITGDSEASERSNVLELMKKYREEQLREGSESQEDQETNNNINSEMEDGLAPSPGSSSESPKEDNERKQSTSAKGTSTPKKAIPSSSRRSSNQTPRRGNATNQMGPPSPTTRDAHSPSRSRDSPSGSSKSVPGYMQPTKSSGGSGGSGGSGASKGPGTPRTRKSSDKKR